MAIDIERALMGLGAAVGGTVPQFRQQMMQEDQMARQRATADEEAAEKRKQTLFADASAASSLLSSGDTRGVVDLMQDRLNILSRLPGVDTRHTARYVEMAKAADQGSRQAFETLQFELGNAVKAGRAYNQISGESSAPSAFRAKQMQAQAAGLQPGTPKYQDFMLYGGAVREEGAKGITRFKDGSYIQITPFGNRVYDVDGSEVTDPEQKRIVIKKGRDEGVVLEGEVATARAQGAAQEGRAQDIITKGLAAADSTAVVRRSLELLKRVETGGFNRVSLAAKKLFGIEGADQGELSANLGKAVLSQLRATFGAAFTAKEGDSLREIEAGFSSSVDTNIRLLNNTLAIAEEAADRAIRRAEIRGDFETADEIEGALKFNLSDIDAEFAAQESGETPAPNVGATPPAGPRVIKFDAQGNRING